MGNTPEKEQDTRGRKEGTHDIDHLRHLRGIAGKLREQVGCQHKEWCPGRMADFEAVASGDKLWAVPE